MLSKRLRRRLRQIDGGPGETSNRRPQDDEARSEPVRAGLPGLSRRRLAEQARRYRESADAPRSSKAADGPRLAVPSGPIEELAPGQQVDCDAGSYWLVRGAAARILPHGSDVLAELEAIARCAGEREDCPLADLRGIRPRELALLDTETGGLSSAPVFLVGLILWECDEPTEALSVQMLARDYAEERAVLAATAQMLAHRRVLMTYNGRSFDMPMIRERMIYHGLGDCPEPPAHIDLLHAIRARFRDELENCRLQTLERRLCGRSRLGDIDGAEIPDAWHDFVHTGDAGRIAQVLEHNRLDLITMLEVLPHFFRPRAVTDRGK